MNYYLSNILPRVKQYSQSLDRKEVFIESPWVIVDEQENKQKYIFKRNGELIMSLNGQVTIGKWEYLPSAKSLLIDRNIDKILLNQSFVDPAVMVLKKDGSKDEIIVLVNEIKIPDLDVEKYLKNLYYEKSNVQTQLLKSGQLIELHHFNELEGLEGSEVTIEGEPVPNGIEEIANSRIKLLIEDSTIAKVLVHQDYNTKYGKITIEVADRSDPSPGDLVFSENNLPAPDGRYKIGFLKNITVQNGRIIK